LCALMTCSRPDPRAVARLFAAFVAAGKRAAVEDDAGTPTVCYPPTRAGCLVCCRTTAVTLRKTAAASAALNRVIHIIAPPHCRRERKRLSAIGA
jgi:hypothetical protein